MRRIVLDTIRNNWIQTIGLFFLVAAIVFISLLPPQLLRILVDDCLVNQDTRQLFILTAGYLLLMVGIGGLDFVKSLVLTKLGQRVINETRECMMEKAEKIPVSFYTSQGTGAITSRFTTDTESINTLFADGVISMAVDGLKIIGIVLSIMLFSVPLAGCAILAIPVIFFFTRTFQRRMKKAQRANLEQLGAVGNHITESIKNVQMIKLLGKEQYMEEVYLKRLFHNYETKQRVNFYDSAYAPIIQIIKAILITGVVLLSSSQLHVLGITAGMLAASIDLLSNLLIPIEALGMEFQNIQQGFAGIRRVDDFFALPEEHKKEELTAKQMIQEECGKRSATVRFDHVFFAYEPGQPVLQDICFEVRPRESLTLTGRTGVGKTTMMNLIMGLLTPNGGTVYINEVPAHLIPDREKRKLFGYVEQQFQFVPGTVLEQITLGDTDINRDAVERVCSYTGLSDYVEGLKSGYDTVITNGSEFSYGQRQLLSIARAIVTDPPILLLDEITANLDVATEEYTLQVLNKVCKDRTVITISHRMTAMREDTRVVHIEQGREVTI